jgi:putative phosphoribosyl transferase
MIDDFDVAVFGVAELAHPFLKGSMRAALRAIRQRGPAKLVLAVPAASPEALSSLRAEVDEVVCLTPRFPFRRRFLRRLPATDRRGRNGGAGARADAGRRLVL